MNAWIHAHPVISGVFGGLLTWCAAEVVRAIFGDLKNRLVEIDRDLDTLKYRSNLILSDLATTKMTSDKVLDLLVRKEGRPE